MSDSVKPGEMGRYVIAQSKDESKSTKGQIVQSWTDTFGFFASVSDKVISESFAVTGFTATGSIIFTTHYRDDLNRKMRIVYEGENYNIISVTRLGISYMKLTCQRIDI